MSDTTLLAVEETQVVSTIFSDTDDQGRQAFKDAMANLGSAVNIVTTLSEGSATGFTATAVCSVTDSPPSLLVCLNHSASVFAAFCRCRTPLRQHAGCRSGSTVRNIWRETGPAGSLCGGRMGHLYHRLAAAVSQRSCL